MKARIDKLSNKLANLSLALGIASIIGVLPAVPALITIPLGIASGIVSMKQKGGTRATIGLCLNLLAAVLLIIWIIALRTLDENLL
jgi:hypothetical protein